MNKNPIEQFRSWFTEARDQNCVEHNAMVLSTVDPIGMPSSRVVYLKKNPDDEFWFFTNFESRKGQDLLKNPKACLLFFWPALKRQVRIEGIVSKLEAKDSDEYYFERPVGSRIGAIASKQSRVLTNREELEAEVLRVTEATHNNPVRPEYWGGYRLRPTRIEFWTEREFRLHNRDVFERTGDLSKLAFAANPDQLQASEWKTFKIWP